MSLKISLKLKRVKMFLEICPTLHQSSRITKLSKLSLIMCLELTIRTHLQRKGETCGSWISHSSTSKQKQKSSKILCLRTAWIDSMSSSMQVVMALKILVMYGQSFPITASFLIWQDSPKSVVKALTYKFTHFSTAVELMWRKIKGQAYIQI